MNLSLINDAGRLLTRRPFFFYLVVLITLVTACSSSENSDTDYETLFQVDDIEISVFQFQTKYVTHLINTGANDSKEERYRFMNEYIDNLLLAQASDTKGLLDDPVYQQAIEFQLRKSMVDIFFVDEMSDIIDPPTDEEVRLAYAKKERRVYVRQLFSMKKSDLTEPYQRLLDGEDFVDVANDFYETATYDSLAGYLGPIKYFGVDDNFAETAYSLNVGEFSEPIGTRFGYHIVYVEYAEFPALLTEDGYQYQKEGITSQVRLRKQRIVSNDYVRDLMSTLKVEIDVDNLAELRKSINSVEEGITQLQPQDVERESDFWEDDLRAELSTYMEGNAILSTFILGGEKIEFTFDDYLQWLPYLPFNESKNRTGASLGRALRNEVLYLLADENGYSSDERVQEKVEDRGYEVLSDLYQYELAMQALSDTARVEVPESFKRRMIRNRQIQMSASYWTISAGSDNEADQIRKEIAEGASPESYAGYTDFEYRLIEPQMEDYSLIRKALVNTPLVAYSAQKGWMVMYLKERELEDVTEETPGRALEYKFKVYDAINSEIEMLRERAEIKVDTTLFDEIYDVWKKKRDEES